MRQFLNGSRKAFQNLETRARRACVRFARQEMPLGCEPATAAVGFEVDPAAGMAELHVARGVSYAGPDPEVHEWLATGSKHFPNFDSLRQWIQGPLAGNYSVNTVPISTHPQAPIRPEQLTDLGAIRVREEGTGSRLLDEQALFEALRSRVRGQDVALRQLAGRTCRHLARRAPRRPATFFAVGPTGVGKTRTAESLVQALRDIEPDVNWGFLRLDMNEYAERYRVSQLLGSPQGYAGYGESAQFVDALVANPRLIVLFDEIEKAHPDVLKVLMNAMDAGRLSTAARTEAGREIDCRQAMFLFTSNLEAQAILDDVSHLGPGALPSAVDAICRNRLRGSGIAPELLGRFGSFLVFEPLSLDARAEVVALAVVRVAEEYGVEVRWIEPDVIAFVLDQTRSDRFGARPYEYLIDDILGGLFGECAADPHLGPICVHRGPPFACRAWDRTGAGLSVVAGVEHAGPKMEDSVWNP